MSTPLTDSINALTAYANETTGAEDATLSDAVHTLVSGYGHGGVNYLDYATRLGNIYYGAAGIPPVIELSPIKLESGNSNGEFMNRATSSAEDGKIELTVNLNQTTPFSLSRFLFTAYYVKKLKITGNLNLCTSYTNAMQGMTSLEEADVDFDFTSCNASTACVLNSATSLRNSVLTTMRFVPNTCKFKLDITGFIALNDDTIVSAANCLVTGVSGQQLALYSTQKARCSTLMGNNDNGTFVADENGTMSLADFIINVKGWTLA